MTGAGMDSPVIAFGQQPNGFFPKRYLVAKIRSALKLQQEIGGKVVFFYHDSDHDYRETITPLIDRTNGNEVRLNFTQENKLQKKYSPLYLKRIPAGWQEEIARKLPTFVEPELVEMFKANQATTVADFCLQMYQSMGLLEGIEVVRSSDRAFRLAATELDGDHFADLPHEGEIVRARLREGKYWLHAGGTEYVELPQSIVSKEQKSPTRDTRFAWMQSVIGCTHYVAGQSEWEYLNKTVLGTVEFVEREDIADPFGSWVISGISADSEVL